MRENIPSNHSETNHGAWQRFHNYWLDEDAPETPLRLLYKELIETRYEPESWARFESIEKQILGMIQDAKEINSHYRRRNNAKSKERSD